MKKVHVILKQDDRVWDAIRDTEDQAFMRIGEHLKEDYDSKVVAIGDNMCWKLLFGNPVVELLESQGFIVEIRELIQEKEMQIVELNVDLYKPSGKWAYNCNCTVGVPDGYVETELLLDLISKAQNQVSQAAVTNGSYIVVIKETDEQMNKPEYQGFLCRMVMAKG